MSSNDTILTMENITKTFGPVKALTDVNLSSWAPSATCNPIPQFH